MAHPFILFSIGGQLLVLAQPLPLIKTTSSYAGSGSFRKWDKKQSWSTVVEFEEELNPGVKNQQWGHLHVVPLTSVCIISAGNNEALQQRSPPVAEIPADPPSFPLILDKDPVPEELVRLNSTLYLDLCILRPYVIVYHSLCFEGVGSLRLWLRLWRWGPGILDGHAVTGRTRAAASGEGGVPARPVRTQSSAGLPCIWGGEDEEEAAALRWPRSVLTQYYPRPYAST